MELDRHDLTSGPWMQCYQMCLRLDYLSFLSLHHSDVPLTPQTTYNPCGFKPNNCSKSQSLLPTSIKD